VPMVMVRVQLYKASAMAVGFGVGARGLYERKNEVRIRHRKRSVFVARVVVGLSTLYVLIDVPSTPTGKK